MRFKLTAGFILVSVVIFAIAAVVITRSAERNEEANLIQVVSEQSNEDAQVIVGVLAEVLESPETTDGLGAATDAVALYDSLAISTFIRNSDIVRLSLRSIDGSLIWSTTSDAPFQLTERNPAFAEAVSGISSTELVHNAAMGRTAGESSAMDLVSTYIPLLDASTNQPAQVIEVTRDVTEVLSSRIASTKNTNFRTVFSTLGGSFFVLFGVVFTADVLLARSRKRSILHEHMLAEEKVVARSLESENQQLKELNEERDRFLSMISHELRTPLTAIMGFTDVVSNRLQGEVREKNIKHLTAMRRNGDHLNSLIEEMLEVTRIHAGKFEIEKDGFELERLLSDIDDAGSVLLKSRGQSLNVVRPGDELELHGDQRRVLQVLLNLVSNASKYSHANSTITVTAEQSGDSLKLSVSDEGDGIPEADCRRLFERFYRRNDEGTRSQSGLGLGLSIVKAIVDAHHGQVEVSSTVGVGTTMTVTLPGSRRVAPQESLAMQPVPLFKNRIDDLRRLPEGVQVAS